MGLERFLRHKLAPMFFYFATRFIARTLPERSWYAAVFRISRVQTFFLRPIFELTPFRRDPRKQVILAWLMNTWLRGLVSFQRPFPIAIRTKGEDVILDACANPKGMVICSVHLPLVNLILRPLIDLGHPPTAVVSGKTVLINQKSPLWGLGDGLPAVVLGRNALLKVRTILRQGGSIAALVDVSLSGSISPNMFRMIRLAGAQLVFVIPELQPDGDILVEYFAPPDPFCKTDKSIMANLEALQTKVDRVLQFPSKRKMAPIRRVRKVSSSNAPAVKFTELDSSS